MNQSKCACGGEGKVLTQPRKFKLGHRAIVVDAEFLQCARCGEEWYSIEQVRATQERAAALLRAKHGLLEPARIRSIRLGLGLTQEGLEQLLGLGPKTVVRWEKGTVVPSSGVNSLLKVLEVIPNAVAILGAEKGILGYEASPDPLPAFNKAPTSRTIKLPSKYAVIDEAKVA